MKNWATKGKFFHAFKYFSPKNHLIFPIQQKKTLTNLALQANKPNFWEGGGEDIFKMWGMIFN